MVQADLRPGQVVDPALGVEVVAFIRHAEGYVPSAWKRKLS